MFPYDNTSINTEHYRAHAGGKGGVVMHEQLAD